MPLGLQRDACYTPVTVECKACGVDDGEKRLSKCPICFQWVCEDCEVNSYGRKFCGRSCSYQFFHGDED